MNVCIYKIVFESGDFYIGQTTDFNRRKRQHLTRMGKGSPLLEKAFSSSRVEDFYILEETTEDQLNDREKYWIDKLNPNLNVLPGGDSCKGLSHPRSKYTREQILEVIRLYNETKLTVKDISNQTGVGLGVCHDVIKGRKHAWAQEEATPHRKAKYQLWDKHNNYWEFDCAKTFVKEHPDLPIGFIYQTNSGISPAGWSFIPHPVVELTSPEGEVFTVTVPEAREFLYSLGLSKYQVNQLVLRHKASAGWKIKEVEGE